MHLRFVVANDHELADRSLLVLPEHELPWELIRSKFVCNLGLELSDGAGLFRLAEIEELDIAREDLRPSEVLRNAVERALDGIDFSLVPPCHVRAEEAGVGVDDVEEPPL